MLGWGMALIALVLFAMFFATLWRIRQITHAPWSIHETSEEEIAAQDTRLQQLGLTIRDGHFLKARPFAPPWTSHSLLLPSNQNLPPVRGIKRWLGVRADLLLADLDVLQPVMERAYGGWDTAAARGWNWNQWFTDWRKQLIARGSASLSYDEAFTPLDTLLAFQRDNHTDIPINRSATYSDLSQTAVLAGVPAGPCQTIRSSARLFPITSNDAGQQVRSAKIWSSGATNLRDTKYISMPRSYGTPQAVSCGGSWIPLLPVGKYPRHGWSSILSRFMSFREKDVPLARIERIGPGIVYARLPTFSPEYYQDVSTQDWAQRQLGDRVLIVDMRNNGGGNEKFGLAALEGWIEEKRLAPLAGRLGIELTSSCLFAPLKWNSASFGSVLSPYVKQDLQGLLDRMAKPYPTDCPRSTDAKPAKWTYLEHHFSPRPGDMRVVVVVNSDCGSDCEGLTISLASLPEAIIVGDNTGGVIQFIQPVDSVLPHTGLQYQFALGHSNYYGDNRSVDGYGLDVDVVLPEVDSLGPVQMRQLAEVVAKL